MVEPPFGAVRARSYTGRHGERRNGTPGSAPAVATPAGAAALRSAVCIRGRGGGAGALRRTPSRQYRARESARLLPGPTARADRIDTQQLLPQARTGGGRVPQTAGAFG